MIVKKKPSAICYIRQFLGAIDYLVICMRTLKTAIVGCAAGTLLFLASEAVFAQSTGSITPNPTSTGPASAASEPPPGSCMPIGLTASGEIVFPIQCKDFIERQRSAGPKAAERGAGKAVNPAPGNQDEAGAGDAKTTGIPEQNKAAADQMPVPDQTATPDQGMAATSSDDKPVISKRDVSAPASPAAQRSADHDEQSPKRRHGESSARTVRSSECKHYRTYDPKSGTYRGYDGRVTSCP